MKTGHSSDSKRKPSAHLSGAVIWVPLLASISVLNSGYRYFCDNHALQITRVKTILDPDLFPADPFAATLSGFVSWLWWLVAQVSRWADLTLVLMVFFLIGRLLLVYSCARLAATLFPESRIAPLTGAFLASLVPVSILADGNLTEVYFEQTSLFMGFFLLALASLLGGRPMSFFVLWGLAFVGNPLYGSWAFFFFAITFAVDPRRPGLVDMAKKAPVFLVMALPILVSSLRVFLQPKTSRELITWVNRLLNSPHVAPETWDPVVFREFGAFVILLSLWAVAVRGRFHRVSRLVLAWCGFGVGAVVVGILASRTSWGSALLPVQPARATDLFYLSAAVAAVAGAGFWAEKRSSGVTLAVASLYIGSVGFLLSPSLRAHTAVFYLAFAISGAVLMVIWKQLGHLEKSREGVLSHGVAAAALGFLFLGSTTWTAAGSLLERGEKWGSVRAALWRGPNPQVLEIADWARESTAGEAVFLHDPIAWEWAQFRYLSERPTFVTWKDGAAVQWDPAYAPEWSQRFAALGFRGRRRDRWNLSNRRVTSRIRQSLRRRYSRFSERDVRRLGARYRIEYWIAPRRTPTTWPVVFRSDDYQIIEVPKT